MYIIHEDSVEGDKIDVPFKRTIRHLSASLGSKKLWLGTSSVEPGNTSNPHAHKEQEEVLCSLYSLLCYFFRSCR